MAIARSPGARLDVRQGERRRLPEETRPDTRGERGHRNEGHNLAPQCVAVRAPPRVARQRTEHAASPGVRGDAAATKDAASTAGSGRRRRERAMRRRPENVTAGRRGDTVGCRTAMQGGPALMARACRDEGRGLARRDRAATQERAARKGVSGFARSTRRRPEDVAAGRRGDTVGCRAARPWC